MKHEPYDKTIGYPPSWKKNYKIQN